MESTPSQDNRDIILDVTLLAENLAEVSNWKAKMFAFSLFISMVVLALKTTFAMIILKKVLLNKFVGHYLCKISTEISKSRRPKTRGDSLPEEEWMSSHNALRLKLIYQTFSWRHHSATRRSWHQHYGVPSCLSQVFSRAQFSGLCVGERTMYKYFV